MDVTTQPLKSVFVLFSALNANGYDKENNSEGMHPLRLKVRKYLETKTFDSFDFEWHPFQYLREVLISEDLKPTSKTNPDFIPALTYLQKFSQETGLDILWEDLKPEIEKEADHYYSKVNEVDKQMALLDLPKPKGKIIFSFNPLQSYKSGFSVTIDDTAYIISGPSENYSIRNLLHELLHAYLRNAKFNRVVSEDIYNQIPEELRKNYPKDKIVEESLIRALVVFLRPEESLGNQDRQLVLPGVYLEKLQEMEPNSINEDVLNNLIVN